ncbi:unnamed protein product [Pleuronectes platessa]|uniref:Uncharacterized protein n=1 Tax=Pleuronectes platessa TaxID=8262 RepID=A0A9N7VTM7_PLEPL|nr:unnamed protein product [Pleuronectes platessa]
MKEAMWFEVVSLNQAPTPPHPTLNPIQSQISSPNIRVGPLVAERNQASHRDLEHLAKWAVSYQGCQQGAAALSGRPRIMKWLNWFVSLSLSDEHLNRLLLHVSDADTSGASCSDFVSGVLRHSSAHRGQH